MLPSVSKKLDDLSQSTKKKEKKSKKSKKLKKASKKHKKEKKKSKKKRNSSSNESDDSTEDEERLSKRKPKRKHFSDVSSSNSSSDSEEDEWVEKSDNTEPAPETETKKKYDASVQRDDWLGGLSSITTFARSKEPKENKKEERKGIDSYDPGKCARELNPYWKDGGDGLPKAFAKPSYDSDDDQKDVRRSYQPKPIARERQSNWKKKPEPQNAPSTSAAKQDRDSRRDYRRPSRTSSSSSSRSPSPDPKPKEESKPVASRDDFLTDQQMNELGAKLVKAEIMGNDDLATELKEKLERARKFRTEHKSEVLAKSYERRAGGSSQNKREKEEKVMLSTTNSKGQSRPVASFRDDSDLWGGRAGRKAKKQKVETHMDGERVRYFADDDRYDIKRMVIFSPTFSYDSLKLIQNISLCSLKPRNSHQPLIRTCNLRILPENIRIQMMIWRIYLRIKCVRISLNTMWRKRNEIEQFESIKRWNANSMPATDVSIHRN